MKTLVIEDKKEIEEIISQCKICYVGMIDEEGTPYVIPMNFGYREHVVYLHSAPIGHVINCLNANNQICITFCVEPQLVFQHPEVACSYRMKAKSVIVKGKVEFIDEFEEKRKALDIIMSHYSSREFAYGEPAVRNVKIWRVKMDRVSAKEYGAPHK